MTFTKEKVQWLHDAATEFASTGMKMTMRPDEILQLTTPLLAVLTAEPVGYIDPFSLQNFATYRTGEIDNKRMGREWMWANSDAGLVPVYTAPPAPVVGADVLGAIKRLLDSDGSRGTFSAVRSYDAREELERLLAAAPQQE